MIKLPREMIINNQTINIDWDESEIKQIYMFYNNARKLQEMFKRKNKDFKDKLSLSMSREQGQPVNITVKLPNEDDKSVLLHNLRPFILEKENTYLNKITNLLSKKINSQFFRDYIKQQNQFFKINQNVQPFQLTVNEQRIINSEETLKLWLNAYEYHRDQEKLKDIQKLTAFLPFNFFEYFMIDSLFAKSQVILNILKFISNIVDKKSCTIEFEKSNKSSERNI